MKIMIMLTMLFGGVSDEEPPPLEGDVIVVEEETQANNTITTFDTIIEWQNPCAINSTKSYMDYRAVTQRSSKQYKYIDKYMSARGGLMYAPDGAIGVALGSWWGDIGSKWTIELTNGQVFDVVKIDEKSDAHVVNGCYHKNDGSVIEMVVDSETTPSDHWGSNGLIWNGNFNNYDKFKGQIKRVGKKHITTKEVDVSDYFPKKIELDYGKIKDRLDSVFFIYYIF